MAQIRHSVFDNIHGYITLTRCEHRIMESAYYQRLRWVQQLGFSFYVFPGATHTRFSHALGVMHVMEQVLRSIGLAAPEEKLFNPAVTDEATTFHRMMRLAAMLHDIGTFPFSHTTELGYINHWKQQRAHAPQKPTQMANHENLGRHILEHTDFPGGVTHILRDEGIDPKALAAIIAGQSPTMIANQLLHSDVDADRMDYLIRDAYYTGVELGTFDRALLIKNMAAVEVDGQKTLCIREEALNVVEYFLIARYSWYSQIINDGASYKFDLIAAKIYQYFLENGLAYSFDELIQDVSQDPNLYFTFNDSYFMSKLNQFLAGSKSHPVIRELAQMLAYRQTPRHIKIDPVQPTLIQSEEHRAQVARDASDVAQWLEGEIQRLDPKGWMVFDIPNRDVIFTKNWDLLKKEKSKNPLLSRDPVKILTRHGEVKLLIDIPNSLMRILSQYRNFIPRIYVAPRTYELLEKHGVLEKMKSKNFKP